jgi:hypothetical protein
MADAEQDTEENGKSLLRVAEHDGTARGSGPGPAQREAHARAATEPRQGLSGHSVITADL